MRKLLGGVVVAAVASCAMATTIGPDGYGYYATNEVPYAFEDISGTGTPLNLSDDSHAYGIPFNFNFYGTAYSNVAVGSNGSVYFQDTYLGLGNVAIPGSNGYGVDRFIAVLWDDQNPSVAGNIYWQVLGSGSTERLVVQWNGVPRYGFSDGQTYEAVLYAQSGDIYAYYADTITGDSFYDSGGDATVGIQGDTSTGLQWSYNQAVITDGLALRYYVPEPASMLLLGVAGLFLRRR